MRTLRILLAAVLVIVLAGTAAAAQGIPVDIPGTGVNFFLYRFEGPILPYQDINAIWANLSSAFAQWVEEGQDPHSLTADDVRILTDTDGRVEIYIKNQFIVEVDDYHAQLNQATRQQLAEKWAANLRVGLEEFVTINIPIR